MAAISENTDCPFKDSKRLIDRVEVEPHVANLLLGTQHPERKKEIIFTKLAQHLVHMSDHIRSDAGIAAEFLLPLLRN